jgi:hypothetical protein
MVDAQMPVHPEQSPRLSSHSGVLVREDVAFANPQGVEKGGIRKRAEQLLDKLQEPLRKFLEPNEAVFCIVRAQIRPSGVEQFMLGWQAFLLSPAVLVITNRRVIHMLVNRSANWRHSFRYTLWGDMEEAKVKGMIGGTLHLKFRNGKKEVYAGLNRNDVKTLKRFLEVVVPAGSHETSSYQGMTNLCPECRAPLTPGIYECPQCRKAFKSEQTAARRSWLIPGGGFFYTGHAVLGVLHGLLEIILIVAALYWVLVALGVATQTPDPGQEPLDKTSSFIVAAMVGAILAGEKWAMASVAKKQARNYLPAA